MLEASGEGDFAGGGRIGFRVNCYSCTSTAQMLAQAEACFQQALAIARHQQANPGSCGRR